MEMYDLTNPQNNIWLIEQHYSNTNVGNIVGILNFQREIDINILIQAVNLLIKNNEGLRIKIKNEIASLKQYLDLYNKFDIPIIKLEKNEVEEYINKFSKVPFNLTDNKLYTFEILKINNEVRLLSKFHHIITDAWSLSLIASEIVDIYIKLKENQSNLIYDYPSYIDIIEEEKNYLTSDKYFKDQKYWNSIYNTEPQILALKNNDLKNNSIARRKEYKLKESFTNQIKMFCKDNLISEYCFFLTALELYINKFYGINDVIIGNPFLNRKNYKEKNTIGMFVNTIPLRFKIENDEMSTLELLKINSLTIRNALKHQMYPYNDILNFVKKKYGINQNLYNILFSYQNAKNNNKCSDINYSTEWGFNESIADNLQIHIHDRDSENTFNIVYDYQKNIFSNAEISKMHEKYIYVIKQLLNNNSLIKNIEITTQEEKDIILNIFNKTEIDFSAEIKYNNIVNLIVNKNINNLDKIALEDKNNKISYRELLRRVNKLSNYLKNTYTLSENENIGIIIEKNIDTIIGILAILKINCTVVPIDNTYPLQRKKYMIDNAEIKTILYTNELTDTKAEKEINIKYEKYEEEKEDTNNYNYDVNNNLYIVYTSGSTGNPKPVTITHKNIINLIMHEITENKIEFNNSRILQFATLSFDVSYQEIFTALLTNSTLVLIEDKLKKDNKELLKYIIEKNIDILFIPPRYLIYLADDEDSYKLTQNLKHIITAGEQLIITKNIERLINKGITIHNHYGPAETHVATAYTIDKNNITVKPPIGKPIANSKIYILDKNKNLCSQGVMGEIYISGDCVGNGYYNKANLTNERFLTDIFNNDYRMYKTGDLGKFDENGNVYYLGRADFQVKVNGFRIEIEEIEKQIASLEYIDNVAITIEKDHMEKNKIIAFIQFKKDIKYEKVKKDILTKLPKYMFPSKIFKINKMPLNSNGKADKKVLENSKENYILFTSSSKNALPTNDTESKILKDIQDVLNTKEVNVEDDFFEVGGDSLLAIALQVKLSKEGIMLNTQEIYDNPSARKIYKYITNKKIDIDNSDIKNIHITPKKVNIEKKVNILLTGSTGFLGVHILNELLKDENNNIYCIVRNKNNKSALERLKETYYYYFEKDIINLINKNIYIFEGDLTKENFGLTNTEYKLLNEKIDIVINVAASVKHYGNREYNYKNNVVSTENILQFVKQKNILLNHISTVGIAGNNLVDTNNCIKDKFTEEDLIIGQKYQDNIYLSTKLQAEQLIIDAIEKNLVYANIIRVGNLMNRYSDNKFQKNSDTNAFQNKMKALIKIEELPDDLKNFTFDLTPIDICSKAIVKLCFYDVYNNVYHVLNNVELSMSEILTIFKELRQKENLEAKIENIKTDWLINDFMINNKKQIKINSLKTQDILEKIGFIWNIDNKYYEKVFKSIIEGA